MSISLFKFGSRQKAIVKLPVSRTAVSNWHPKILEKFPDFTAPTTKGVISFSDWASGHWVVLLSHPAAFTPVCTSEIGCIARHQSEFNERNVKVIALTTDPLERIKSWTTSIEETYDVQIDFPHVSDEHAIIARGCGLLMHMPLLGGDFCSRRTFLIDPAGTIRMILDYPVTVGRSVEELLRVIDASLLSERMGLLAPSDWHLGEPLMLLSQSERPDLTAFFDNPSKHENVCFHSDHRHQKASQPQRKAKRLPDINVAEVDRINRHQKRLAISRLVDFPED